MSASKILILVLMLTVFNLTLCSAESTDIRAFSDDVTEELLLGINDGQYPAAAKFFDDKMKNALNKKRFAAESKKTKKMFGQYISKEYTRAESKESYKIIDYKAKFTKDDNVTVRTVLTEDGSGFLIAGFWILKN
ncbi:DUF3887 domain-containing protein [Pectinatus haikarae]|uniref:DUF3887 domain-containing protein n=1 Tax=Pectinatus haikarae TaxID=349096 RepID=A0ABT9Y6S1_9FIRM|nr:DUF3887 domain-containing protein [Pectinatus haikarae]MDQ0203515.1 hypothetical protein [Pectinatus haikarae]